MHTNIDISSSKVGLTTLLAQLVSILRAKVWKIFMKCKSFMFSFCGLFFKFYIFEVITFFLA